ncbi:MAG: class I SAM-dependent methyltransferase [Gemmatimonadaceae bacterium]
MSNAAIGLTFKNYEGVDYEEFWRGAGREYEDRVERRIIEHVMRGGGAMADIGAGFGRLGACYVGKYERVAMVEPASNLREIAQRIYRDRVQYYDNSIYQLPFPDGSLDAIMTVRVVHHLAEPERAIREMHRVLKPGGTMLFEYSNKRNIARIAKFLLLGRGENPFTPTMTKYLKDLVGHHPAVMTDYIERAGFEVTAEYGAGITDKIVKVLPFLVHVLRRPSITAAAILGRLRLAPMIFVVARKK